MLLGGLTVLIFFPTAWTGLNALLLPKLPGLLLGCVAVYLFDDYTQSQ